MLGLIGVIMSGVYGLICLLGSGDGAEKVIVDVEMRRRMKLTVKFVSCVKTKNSKKKIS